MSGFPIYQDPSGDKIVGMSNPLPTQTISNTLSTVITLQNAASTTGVGTPLPTSGQGVASIAISGTFVATITFEGQAADGNWYGINVRQRGGATIASTATGTGLFEINVLGLTAVRANITSYISGNITVKGQTQALTPTSDTVQINGVKYEAEVKVIDGIAVVAGGSYFTSSEDLSSYSGIAILGNIEEASTTASTIIAQWTDGSTKYVWLASANFGTTVMGSGVADGRLRGTTRIIVGVKNNDSISHKYHVWKRNIPVY
jgi:hypothetical protein